MAKKKWTVLPGGRIKRWKYSKIKILGGVPPHWYRNHLNRKERHRSKRAIFNGKAHSSYYVHRGTAYMYW